MRVIHRRIKLLYTCVYGTIVVDLTAQVVYAYYNVYCVQLLDTNLQ